MRTVCSSAPLFLPSVSFWNKMAHSEVCVLRGGLHASYVENLNRTKLENAWLTLPLVKESRNGSIQDVLVRDTRTAAQVLAKTLRGKKYPYADRIREVIFYLETAKSDRLWDVNYRLTRLVANLLGLKTEFWIDFVRPVDGLSKTTNLVYAMNRWINGETVMYMADQGELAYLNRLETSNLQVRVQQFVPAYEETILQLIARVEAPMAHLVSDSTWVVL